MALPSIFSAYRLRGRNRLPHPSPRLSHTRYPGPYTDYVCFRILLYNIRVQVERISLSPILYTYHGSQCHALFLRLCFVIVQKSYIKNRLRLVRESKEITLQIRMNSPEGIRVQLGDSTVIESILHLVSLTEGPSKLSEKRLIDFDLLITGRKPRQCRTPAQKVP